MNTTVKMPVLKAETVFRSSDNVSFSTRKDATIHEIGLNLRRALIENGFPDHDGKIKQICMELVKKNVRYKPVFDLLKNANAMKS